MNRLFLDYDSSIGWLWRLGPLWDDLLPLVRMEAQRLAKLFPLGHVAVIMRSDNGWHLKFPHSRLTQEQMEVVMIASMSHRGHVYFSIVIKDSTLRVSKKPYKNSHEPFLVEVMNVG